MTRSAPAAVVVHRRSGPAAPRPSPQPSDAPPAGPDELRLDRARVSEVIPNSGALGPSAGARDSSEDLLLHGGRRRRPTNWTSESILRLYPTDRARVL